MRLHLSRALVHVLFGPSPFAVSFVYRFVVFPVKTPVSRYRFTAKTSNRTVISKSRRNIPKYYSRISQKARDFQTNPPQRGCTTVGNVVVVVVFAVTQRQRASTADNAFLRSDRTAAATGWQLALVWSGDNARRRRRRAQHESVVVHW